ncbi:disulfide bond formation protein B [Sphingomonas spermidinifaciens]|uniref:Disulfide bond formation protein B n=1 Tax=Sphingomonas spermidinifaciens TaxID=1141889 RepID=A0A2A4B672_9SPHN|nr:disulfide bond formation protein B [Sphingomonas spermidinifaciens]PCD03289.1 disulfide bond formation protein B [Sphingomonas spermidinifaciens]
MPQSLTLARLLALVLPLALLAGAWASQLFGGLYPCEMCHWQRWPHYAALAPALLAFALPGRAAKRAMVTLAALLIAVSGAIGVFHAGVEYHWWQGITACTAPAPRGGDLLADILSRPMIRCDVAQWTLGGVSLAGFNAIFSLTGATAILVLAWKRHRA